MDFPEQVKIEEDGRDTSHLERIVCLSVVHSLEFVSKINFAGDRRRSIFCSIT
jgi:hypothetical protein